MSERQVPIPDIQSGAFTQALLRSERLRILGILGCVIALWIAHSVRAMVLRGSGATEPWLPKSIMAAIFVAYELLMLRAVARTARAGKDLRAGVWMLNIAIETSIPAVAVAMTARLSVAAPFRPLATPATAAFFLFIILSTLRLNPRLCHLTGLLACAGYLVAATYAGWRPYLFETSQSEVAQTAVPLYAGAMLVGGVVAGTVAREIRKQVTAALREAEAQRQVDRLERDMDIARSIQQSLLPDSAPQMPDFEIAGWSRPADKTGGDYFDWQPLSDGRLVVTLADVAGHGLGPALVAAVCRAYARASFGPGIDLQTSLARINRMLMHDLPDGRFVTFVAAVCTPGAKEVELLSAGHGPILVYRAGDDGIRQLDPQGLPLGLASDFASEPPHRIALEPGDAILLATDGFFEWADAGGNPFGVARVAEGVRASRVLPAEQALAALYDAVVRFSGGTPQQDDLTAVIIRRHDAPGKALSPGGIG